METLDALEKNELGCRKLLITMPPRHAKSFIATVHFPVYYLARKPNRNVLSTSYNQDLSKTFGRQVRDLAREPIVSQAFADFGMSEESRAVDDWRTTMGGTYFATGIGGSTTGRAATLLVLDDPIKAREEADSATQRNKTWSYYVSALTTRKQPEPDGTPPLEIVILTRWHPDDVGRQAHGKQKNGEKDFGSTLTSQQYARWKGALNAPLQTSQKTTRDTYHGGN